jgi:hypothetical protein
MSYVLSFLPEVEQDVLSSYAWYEEKTTGLGEEFLRLFYAQAREIPRNPFLHSTVFQDFRRRLLRRFPYAIYFRIEGETVVIYGLFHCARDPHIIKKSIKGRS